MGGAQPEPELLAHQHRFAGAQHRADRGAGTGDRGLVLADRGLGKSVLLDDDEQAAIVELTSPSDEMRAVLTGWADAHDVSLGRHSESAILRALIRVGLESLREARLEAGYRALAQEIRPDERAEVRGARARHIAKIATE